MAVTPTTSAQFLEILRSSGILPAEKLQQTLAKLPALPDSASAAADRLIEHDVISRFQANLILLGKYKGFRLGSYVIRDVLGRGGMGAVYLAEHQTLRRKVAIKVLVNNKDADTKLAKDRFLREGRAAAALDHPNIVRIFDVSHHGDTPYLVMEYVDGETLQQKLDRTGPVPYAEAAEYIAQAASGLQHAHEKGFVHRDIKPANLMRNSEGTIKILDMGLARTYDKDEEKLTEVMDKGAIVGTADFISPEQALNNPIDIRADIYSLGATFFALVAGKPPFDGNTTQKLMQHQLKAAPALRVLNSTLPEGLTHVVAKMLAKRPEGRYAIPADVIAALHPWMTSSHRVLAGLSRTRLAESSDIQMALMESGQGGSSMRLSTVSFSQDGPGSGFASQAESMTDTANSLQACSTAATPQSRIIRTMPVEKAPVNELKSAEHRRLKQQILKNKQTRLIACGAAVAVTVGIAFAIMTIRQPSSAAGNTPPDTQDPPAALVQTPTEAPPRLPLPVITAPTPVASTEPRSIYSLKAEDVAPFHLKINGKTLTEGNASSLPANITLYTGLDTNNLSEISRDVIDDVPALKLHATRGTANTTIIIDLEPEGKPLTRAATYAATIEYRSETGRMNLTPVTINNKILYPERAFTHTGAKNEWATVQTEFRRGVDPICLMIASKASGEKGAIYIRSVDVSEVAGPSAPVPNDGLLQTLSHTGQMPFSSLYEAPLEITSKTGSSRILMKSGDGKAPFGWLPRALSKGCQIEYCFDESKKAFGLVNIVGPGDVSLTAPYFTSPSGAVRVQLEFQSEAEYGDIKVRFRPLDGSALTELILPTPTPPNEWVQVDKMLDLKGRTSGQIEFLNKDPRPECGLYFRTYTLHEVPLTLVSQPVEGAKLFSLDVSAIEPFRNKKLGDKLIEGTEESLPRGVFARSSRTTTTGEFFRSTHQSVPVLGVAIASGDPSIEYAFELEQGMGLTLKSGVTYRAKIEYQTSQDGFGALDAQLVNDLPNVRNRFKTIATTSLSSAPGGWKTATLDFPRVDNTPAHILIKPCSVAMGSCIYLKSLEIVELK